MFDSSGANVRPRVGFRSDDSARRQVAKRGERRNVTEVLMLKVSETLWSEGRLVVSQSDPAVHGTGRNVILDGWEGTTQRETCVRWRGGGGHTNQPDTFLTVSQHKEAKSDAGAELCSTFPLGTASKRSYM